MEAPGDLGLIERGAERSGQEAVLEDDAGQVGQEATRRGQHLHDDRDDFEEAIPA